jgi:arsenate reductase
MAEIGVDIGTQRSKPVDEFTELRFDYVVTVCDQARETCPIFPGAATQLHWSFRDPAAVEGSEEPRLSAFRSVRNEITAMIQRVILEGPAKEGAS